LELRPKLIILASVEDSAEAADFEVLHENNDAAKR
jgi:hypothetical protein